MNNDKLTDEEAIKDAKRGDDLKLSLDSWATTAMKYRQLYQSQCVGIHNLRASRDALEKGCRILGESLKVSDSRIEADAKRIAELEKKVARQLEIYHRQRKSLDAESAIIESLQAEVEALRKENKALEVTANHYRHLLLEEDGEI